MAGAKDLLVVFDFDHSLVDGNTDTWVIKLGDEQLKKVQANWHKTFSCWTDLMDHIFSCLHAAGVSSEQILSHMTKIPFDDDMKASCRLLLSNPSVEAIILSDSNTLFINSILRHAGLEQTFSKVFTNPAQVLTNDRITVQHFHSHSCSVCNKSPNLCKGSVLEQFLKQTGQRRRVLYIGDGGGDLCPSLHLCNADMLLARKGYTLAKTLADWPRGLEQARAEGKRPLSCQLVHWSSGQDVLDTLTTFLASKSPL